MLEKFVYENKSAVIDFQQGAFDFNSDEYILTDIQSILVINGQEINLLQGAVVAGKDENLSLSTILLSNRFDDFSVEIRITIHKEISFLSLHLKLTNLKPYFNNFEIIPVKISVKSLSSYLGGGLDTCRMLINPFSFDLKKCGMTYLNGKNPLWGDCEAGRSCLYSVVSNPENKQSLLLGYIPPALDISNIEYNEESLLARSSTSEQLNVGEIFECDRILLGSGNNGHDLLHAYSTFFPKAEPVKEKHFAVGWNSWDYYFNSVQEKDIAENIDAICRIPWLKEKIEYIIIDASWQRGYGDWDVSSRFCGNLERIIEKIKENGFIPGIWVAPFLVDYFTPLGLRAPQLLAKNREDKITFAGIGDGGQAILDPTSPDGEVFLRDLFGKLKKMGFKYFKVDFVKNICKEDKFQRGDGRKLTPVIRGLQIIKETIGDDAFLLGCGMPVQVGHGLITANRISTDISTYWSNILSSARQLSISYWINRTAWVNDPDFLVVRNVESSNDAQMNPFFIPKEYSAFESRAGRPIDNIYEARVWASLVILSGGIITLSDRISMLNENGLRIIKTTLNNLCENAALPVDLFEKGLSTIWLQKGNGFYHLAIFNWSDDEMEMQVDLESLPWMLHGNQTAMEIWTEECRLLNVDEILNLKMNKREVKFFKIATV